MFNCYQTFILLNKYKNFFKIDVIRKPTPMEASEVAVLADWEDVVVGGLCTVVEEAVLGILLREDALDFEIL
jgi:hypothetical protein